MIGWVVLTDPMERALLPEVISVLLEARVLVKADDTAQLPAWVDALSSTDLYRISGSLLQKALLELLMHDDKQNKKLAEQMQRMPAQRMEHIRSFCARTLLGAEEAEVF